MIKLPPRYERFIRYSLLYKVISHYKSMELKFTQNNIKAIKKNDIICICVFRNEKPRLPYFLQYYRKMGIGHFVFLDNNSTDGAREYLAQFDDCTVLRADGSYKASHYGLHWVNYLLNKYFCGHWIVHVDPDEFLVYPYMDTRDIHALTGYLDGVNRSSFNTMLVDCYGKDPVDTALYKEGMNPLDVCPWFDPYGYHVGSRWFKGQHIAGGVRARAFFSKYPQQAPALHKTPLVKWRKNCSFCESTHFLYPLRLNRVKGQNDYFPTGCLLHFKFFASIQQKVDEELTRKEHWGGSFEYQAYAKSLLKQAPQLWTDASKKYEDWRTLAECKLLGTGNWS